MPHKRLSDQHLSAKLEGAIWRHEDNAIVREFELADFKAVIDMVDQIAVFAEQANHHPDLLIHGWNKLKITLSTHSAGGVTDADLEMAERIDGLIDGTVRAG